jgi:hypothetical protein
MRVGVMIIALSSALGLYGCSHTNARPTALSGPSDLNNKAGELASEPDGRLPEN